MRELEPGQRLLVASHNPGKVREIEDLVCAFGLSTVSAATLNLLEPEETGVTFAENASIKARAAAKASSLTALADDSGLEVDDLQGAPGIYSARWAGPEKDFSVAMKRVMEELGRQRPGGQIDPPRANFTCALCVAWPDGKTAIFKGKISGHLVWPARGTRGFGYDPLFVPDGHDITFGEMHPKHKHAISHRAHAFSKFVDACLRRG